MQSVIQYNKDLQGRKLGEGVFASVYLTSYNKAFKRFKDPENFIDCVKWLQKVNSSLYVFPEQLVYCDDMFIGYIMEYVDGLEIKNLTGDIELKDYIKALKVAEYAIAGLNHYRVHTFDLNAGNVIYTKDNRFKVIDTDLYYKADTVKGLYSSNLSDFAITSLRPFFDIEVTRFDDNRLRSEKDKIFYGYTKPSRFIEMVLEYMNLRNINGVKLSDFSNELKLLYKIDE